MLDKSCIQKQENDPSAPSKVAQQAKQLIQVNFPLRQMLLSFIRPKHREGRRSAIELREQYAMATITIDSQI